MTAMFLTQAGARYRAVGDDGIAASPKVRQMVDERKRSSAKAPAAATVAGCQAPAGEGIANSARSCGQCSERSPQQPQVAPIK